MNNDLITSSMHFFIRGQVLIVTYAQRSEDQLTQLRENAVVIVLTDGKVHVISCNHIQVQLTELLNVLPFGFVLVPLDLFASHAVPELEQLDNILCSLLEDYEPIDVPCVKSNAVLPVEYEFSEEFKCD